MSTNPGRGSLVDHRKLMPRVSSNPPNPSELPQHPPVMGQTVGCSIRTGPMRRADRRALVSKLSVGREGLAPLHSHRLTYLTDQTCPLRRNPAAIGSLDPLCPVGGRMVSCKKADPVFQSGQGITDGPVPARALSLRQSTLSCADCPRPGPEW